MFRKKKKPRNTVFAITRRDDEYDINMLVFLDPYDISEQIINFSCRYVVCRPNRKTEPKHIYFYGVQIARKFNLL